MPSRRNTLANLSTLKVLYVGQGGGSRKANCNHTKGRRLVNVIDLLGMIELAEIRSKEN